jgi:hypothetical protein
VDLFKYVDDYPRYVWSRAIRILSVESVWRVGRVFPYRVYIDSNIACLWQSSHRKLNELNELNVICYIALI